MSRILPERMPGNVRRLAYLTCLSLWVSGCAWMVLNYFFATSTEFGPAPHPWQPLVLKVHGWIAVLTVFLLGWISSGHILERWQQPRNRLSGFSLAGLAALLALTGYALYYTTDELHTLAARIHEVVGAAAALLASTHWWRRSAR